MVCDLKGEEGDSHKIDVRVRAGSGPFLWILADRAPRSSLSMFPGLKTEVGTAALEAVK